MAGRRSSSKPLPAIGSDTLEDVLTWMAAHLDEDMDVDSLAARAHMSSRTFARRFRAETGTTPHRWVTAQRILLAQRLLEESSDTIDVVAERTGFGTAAGLRHHFLRMRGTTPPRVPTDVPAHGVGAALRERWSHGHPGS